MKRSFLIIICAVLVLCISAVGAFSFLTSKTEPTINTFSIGNIEIKLIEPKWSALPDENKNNIPDKAENLSPNETIIKDPTITNVGANSAFVYLKISIPKKAVRYMNDSGTIIERNEDNPIELFTYKTNTNWVQFMVDNSEDCNDYYYYYDKALSPNETTVALFDSVTFLDVIEGQLEEQRCDIPIVAYGVQFLDGDTQITSWNQIATEKNLPVCEDVT